jgi:hypothetical protein
VPPRCPRHPADILLATADRALKLDESTQDHLSVLSFVPPTLLKDGERRALSVEDFANPGEGLQHLRIADGCSCAGREDGRRLARPSGAGTSTTAA